jgi:hypothetical protein
MRKVLHAAMAALSIRTRSDGYLAVHHWYFYHHI